MPVAQETSIQDQVRALIRLQLIDSRIDQIEKLRGDLPDEIRDLEDEKAGLETRIGKYKDEHTESEILRKKAELDIAECEDLIKRYQDQQLQVRNNREYDALTKEIEVQKQRIIDATNSIEALEIREKENEAAREESGGRLAELDGLLESKRTDLGSVLEDTKQEQATLEKHRNDASNNVDPRYFRAYSRLRQRLRDGRAVVPLVRGAAGGYAVPPQRQVEIRQRNRIVVCEHTGRIIVDEDFYQEVGDNLKL